MCLSKIDKRYRRLRTKLVYKTIIRMNDGYATSEQNFPIDTEKEMTDPNEQSILMESIMDNYPSGFHGWATLSAAKKWRKAGTILFNVPEKMVVARFRLSEIHTKGTQNNHTVYVGKKLKFIGLA